MSEPSESPGAPSIAAVVESSSSPQLILYATPDVVATQKIRAVAALSRVSLSAPSETFVAGVDDLSESFKATISAQGRLPALKTEWGVLNESNAIAWFLAQSRSGDGARLLGTGGALDEALVQQWIAFAVTEIELPAAAWLYPITGVVKTENPAATAQAKRDIRRVLQQLNAHLALPRITLVGDQLSLADIVVAFALLPLYRLVLDAPFRAQFEHVNEWFLRVVELPEVRDQIGAVTLCDKMQTAPK
jgi:elongation factor 1-gamma